MITPLGFQIPQPLLYPFVWKDIWLYGLHFILIGYCIVDVALLLSFNCAPYHSLDYPPCICVSIYDLPLSLLLCSGHEYVCIQEYIVPSNFIPYYPLSLGH
jgi:hypothetical protein